MVEFLLIHGADVDAANQRGQTALHLAAGAGFSEVALLLLEHQASANSRDGAGNTPLMLAPPPDLSMAEVLVAHGADVNEPDGAGLTPLFQAVGMNWPRMAGFLLSRGADVNATI